MSRYITIRKGEREVVVGVEDTYCKGVWLLLLRNRKIEEYMVGSI